MVLDSIIADSKGNSELQKIVKPTGHGARGQARIVKSTDKRYRKWVLGKSVLISRHVMRSNEVDLVKREDVV